MSNILYENGLLEEARLIISKLGNSNVPRDGLNYFTVGENFRHNLLLLKKSILNLADRPSPIERVIVGGFGAGKTHFLSYLEWLLRRDVPEACVISQIDLSDIRDPNELQFLIVKNLRLVQGRGDYAEVLRYAYKCIRDKYVARYSNVSQRDIEHVYGTLLFTILGQVTGGWVSEDLLKLLGVSDPINRLINFFSGKTISSIFEQARRQASSEHTKFVETYLHMVRHPDIPISAFEDPARSLSHRGELTDVIFKVLSLSGIRMVVVLLDELESLNRFDTTILRQTLTSIRNFRDTFGEVGSSPGYPSIALIAASTEAFFEEIHIQEPALYSRWQYNVISLKPFSPPDIDNLIFKLRELFYLAGHHLRPIQWNIGEEHEVIKIRDKILTELQAQPSGITTRRLVSRLLAEIDQAWVQ